MTYSKKTMEALDDLYDEYYDIIDDKPHKGPSGNDIQLSKLATNIQTAWKLFSSSYDAENHRLRRHHITRRAEYHIKKSEILFEEARYINTTVTNNNHILSSILIIIFFILLIICPLVATILL